jgi:hypothetical protein
LSRASDAHLSKLDACKSIRKSKTRTKLNTAGRSHSSVVDKLLGLESSIKETIGSRWSSDTISVAVDAESVLKGACSTFKNSLKASYKIPSRRWSVGIRRSNYALISRIFRVWGRNFYFSFHERTSAEKIVSKISPAANREACGAIWNSELGLGY